MIIPVPVADAPIDPKSNGCHANNPICGDPIDPATGNHWQTESDYAVSAPGGLALVRTYNSNPYSLDANTMRSFGTRWTSMPGGNLRDRPQFSNRSIFQLGGPSLCSAALA